MSVWLHNLPQVLSGLPDVGWYPGWETRSRRSGGYDAVMAVAVHHTASNTTTERDIRFMWMNAPERPIGAIYLSRTGAIVVGAAGATNCQGLGGPRQTSKGTIPLNRGNQNAIAIEAANTGTGEPWPEVQQDRYIALVQKLIAGYGLVPGDVFAHHEWTGRKIDPAGPSRFGSVNRSGSWNMDLFRTEVVGVVEPPPVVTPPPTSGVFTVNGYRMDVRQGTQGKMAKMCQQQINLLAGQGIAEDGNFGSQSVAALKRVQTVLGVPSDGWCGQQTWQAFEDGIKTQATSWWVGLMGYGIGGLLILILVILAIIYFARRV